MNDNYLTERWIVTLLMVVVAVAFFLIGKKIALKSKYSGQTKVFLTIIIASICSLLFFYPCAIIDDQFGIGNKYITGMALVFIPISFLLLIVFTILFFVKKSKLEARK